MVVISSFSNDATFVHWNRLREVCLVNRWTNTESSCRKTTKNILLLSAVVLKKLQVRRPYRPCLWMQSSEGLVKLARRLAVYSCDKVSPSSVEMEIRKIMNSRDKKHCPLQLQWLNQTKTWIYDTTPRLFIYDSGYKNFWGKNKTKTQGNIDEARWKYYPLLITFL